MKFSDSQPEPPRRLVAAPPPKESKEIPLDQLYPEPDPNAPKISCVMPVFPAYEESEDTPLTIELEPMGPIILITPIRSAADFDRLNPFYDSDG